MPGGRHTETYHLFVPILMRDQRELAVASLIYRDRVSELGDSVARIQLNATGDEYWELLVILFQWEMYAIGLSVLESLLRLDTSESLVTAGGRDAFIDAAIDTFDQLRHNLVTTSHDVQVQTAVQKARLCDGSIEATRVGVYGAPAWVPLLQEPAQLFFFPVSNRCVPEKPWIAVCCRPHPLWKISVFNVTQADVEAVHNYQ